MWLRQKCGCAHSTQKKSRGGGWGGKVNSNGFHSFCLLWLNVLSGESTSNNGNKSQALWAGSTQTEPLCNFLLWLSPLHIQVEYPPSFLLHESTSGSSSWGSQSLFLLICLVSQRVLSPWASGAWGICHVERTPRKEVKKETGVNCSEMWVNDSVKIYFSLGHVMSGSVGNSDLDPQVFWC